MLVKRKPKPKPDSSAYTPDTSASMFVPDLDLEPGNIVAGGKNESLYPNHPTMKGGSRDTDPCAESLSIPKTDVNTVVIPTSASPDKPEKKKRGRPVKTDEQRQVEIAQKESLVQQALESVQGQAGDDKRENFARKLLRNF